MPFVALLWFHACSGGSAEQTLAVEIADPLMALSRGVERVQRFGHPSCGSHSGVDAVRMPRFDASVGEYRDDYLYVSSGATGVLASLVDDEWSVRSQRYWPVTGASVVWSDVIATRIVDNGGRERAYVYFASRGTNQLEITDVTDFPTLTTVRWPIQIGLPVTVRGVHTMRLDAERGILVLNGVDVFANPLPAPLTPGCSPAVFFDVKNDPLRPRLLSVFVGPDAGDQTLFDSQFLDIDGHPVWATTIQQPQRGNVSYFAFYDASAPTRMATARRLAVYGGPATGSMHNVVQLQNSPDGHPRLAAGFEAYAFGAAPNQVISKAAVLDATGLWQGRNPELVGWLTDAGNRLHAVHNVGSRMLECRSHTWDSVPLEHFTGGYFTYQCQKDQSTVRMLAHVPLSATPPAGSNGYFHANMTVPTWPAVYNGGWDVVTTPFGDYVSSTDLQASFLIEPTYGFVRQFGSYRPGSDGVVARISVLSELPEVGQELRLRVTGLESGSSAHIVFGTKVAKTLPLFGGGPHLAIDRLSILQERKVDVVSDSCEVTLASIPAVQQLVIQCYMTRRGSTNVVLKTPAILLRPRPVGARMAAPPELEVPPARMDQCGCGDAHR